MKRMKMISIVILMLLVSLGNAFAATPADPPAAKGATTGDTYVSADPVTLSIKAYKNTPDPVLMTLYDALTTQLDEITTNHEINITPHIGDFLSQFDVTTSTPNIDTSTRKPVLFSYLVTGGSTGAFDLNISISAFEGPYQDGAETIDPASKTTVNALFQIANPGFSFAKTGKTYNTGEYYDIISTAVPTDGKFATANTPATFTVSWKVDPRNSAYNNAIGEFWIAEGVVMMNIQETGANGYTSADVKSGSYKSKVRVELAPKV